MSRRDELAAVIGEAAALSLVESEWAANAVLAWLGEQLGDEGLLEAVSRALHAKGDCPCGGWSYTYADAARAAVREWFGVTE